MHWHPHPWLPGVHPSPNLHLAPDLYESGLAALDPEQKLEQRMHALHDWTDQLVLDLGAGSGYYLPRFAEAARHVFAVEPHNETRLLALQRAADLALTNVSVLTGSAEQIFLPNNSIDLVVARYAYFWGPGCEKGLQEVHRVLKPGGQFFIIDHDRRKGEFASWLNRLPHYPKGHDLVEHFWRDQGFIRESIPAEWRFPEREILEAVVRNELPPEIVETILKEHSGLAVEYVFALYRKSKK